MIYTTTAIDKLIDTYLKGGPMPKIFFRNNFGERKPGIKFSHTSEELSEYAKCSNDIVYFANTYCGSLTPLGYRQIKLRDYQIEAIRNYERYNHFITVGSRQMGISSILSIIMLHGLLFDTNKKTVMISPKRVISQESLNSIRNMYANIPFFLKPGIVEADLNSMKLENGNSIEARRDVVRAQVHRCFLLDFGYFGEKEAESLFKSIVPVLTAIKDTKLVISNTGKANAFLSKIVQDSERKVEDLKKNSFHTQKNYWWEVEGRDNSWKEDMIKCIGSQKDFDEEYNLISFHKR